MADNSASNKRIAKNSLFLSIRMVFVLGITLYTTRAVLSVLGVEDYGIYNVVCGFVSMFAFLNTSMSNGVQRFFNYELGKNGVSGAIKVYNTALRIQFILALVILVLIEIFGLWYLHNKMIIPAERFYAAEWIFQFAVFSFLFVIMQAPFTAAVMAHERMNFYALISILDAVLSLGIIFVIPLINGDNLILYGFLLMIVKAANLILYYIYCKRQFEEIKLVKRIQNDLFQPMLGFSGWNLFGSFSGVLREHGVSLIMNLFFGPVVNAARGVATQINAGLQSFVHNITTPVRPQVVQSFAQGNITRTMNLTYSISKLSCYFLTMLAIPICLEIDFVLRLWLGNNIPDHTATFSIIVVSCSYQGNLNAAISSVVHATGKMKNYQFFCSLVKILSVPIAYILLNNGMQAEIALLTVMFFDILGHITALFILRGLVEFSIMDYTKRVVVPILVVLSLSLACTYPVHHVVENAYLRFALVTIVSFTIVSLASYYLGLEKSERNLVLQFISAITKKIKRHG